jgi:hypothetical protein
MVQLLVGSTPRPRPAARVPLIHPRLAVGPAKVRFLPTRCRRCRFRRVGAFHGGRGFVEGVEETTTRSGNTWFVRRDRDGREYSTFRPAIGKEAARFHGRGPGSSFTRRIAVDSTTSISMPSSPLPNQTALPARAPIQTRRRGARPSMGRPGSWAPASPKTPLIATSCTSGSSRSNAASPRTSATRARRAAARAGSRAYGVARSADAAAMADPRHDQVVHAVSEQATAVVVGLLG